jgi:hypothetical protein
MNMDKWQRLIETDMNFALARLKDRGELAPMATIHDHNNGVHLVALSVGEDEKTRLSMRLVRLMAVACDAEAVSTLGEMWARFMQPYHGESREEYEARVVAVRPREAEDRREVVMSCVYYRDAQGRPCEASQSRDIIRGPDGKVIGLGPAPDYDVMQSEGQMTHLLPERRPNREQMLYAKQLLKRGGFEL